MTFEECVKILPDELEKIGYKTRPAKDSSFDTILLKKAVISNEFEEK